MSESQVNKHGLPRHIPDGVKRQVRQSCGFGCVNCGHAYCQYHHFDPAFEDAYEHDPQKIMLLCGRCHDLETRGALSNETLVERFEKPKCRELGFSHGHLDVGTNRIQVQLGTVGVYDPCRIIQIYGDEVLSILPPEEPGAPFRINARVFNREGKPIFNMHDNNWEAGSSSWDVEIAGRVIIIRLGQRDILLRLRQEPPNRFVVEKLQMQYRGVAITAVEGKSIIIQMGDGRRFKSGLANIVGCEAAISINDEGMTIGLNHRYASFEDFELKT